jgi:hypothetical protein
MTDELSADNTMTDPYDRWAWNWRVTHEMSGVMPDVAWLQWPGEVYACWSGRNETSVMVTIAPSRSGHALHVLLRVGGQPVGERFHQGNPECSHTDCQVPGLGKAVASLLTGCDAWPTVKAAS